MDAKGSGKGGNQEEICTFLLLFLITIGIFANFSKF
jgi:hypothetical protein